MNQSIVVETDFIRTSGTEAAFHQSTLRVMDLKSRWRNGDIG